MRRSKKIILLAHCLLNANAKVGGLCTYPAVLVNLLEGLVRREIGIIQLPCPEMLLYGSRRWGHVREQFAHPAFRRGCRQALQPIVDQLVDYRDHGYQLLGVIGIDGSPSCGVAAAASSGQWSGDFLDKEATWAKVDNLGTWPGPGVMIEELQVLLAEAQLELPFFAVAEQREEASGAEILVQLDASAGMPQG